jgi:hypothetical protein
MLRKRYYILFVARDEDGRIRKIPLPIHYAYGFVAAALIGAFTIVGLAGSYTRMLLKTESFNQMRAEQDNLRKSYKQMAQIAHDRDGSLRTAAEQAERSQARGRSERGSAHTSRPGADRPSQSAANRRIDRPI